MRVRRWLAFPFKAAACVLLVVAFLISAKGMRDTLGEWMRREFP